MPTKSFELFSLVEVEQSISQRFEKQVACYPDVLAIADGEYHLTYAQLNQRANQIAHTILDQRGIQPEPVIVLFEQGANFLAAIFGVLKTGKSYVPVDPTFPQARNAYIVQNSQARLIVTNRANRDVAEALAAGACDVLELDAIAPHTPVENPDLVVSPDALAYIIYTSGSTGQPKGVFQNHRNVLHNCRNQTNAFHLGVGDRMPLVHSCSVMGAVRVIYNALLNGVSLYPLDIKVEGLAALRDLLLREKITVFHSVATLFRHCSEIFTGADHFPHLRLVILGGEAMSRKDVELYQRYFPDHCLLCTGLGSTEAGTICIFMLNKQIQITSSLVPPGYPVDGMEVLLLDETGNPVPQGEVGEIVVKSRHLALGYWQHPELTESTFHLAPHGQGERLLRTGDMGYYRPDGCLVHVGRKDFQVKIRGYRVNVSEIEMALMDSGLLKEVVVVGREDVPGEMYLVAYIVPRQQPAPSVRELRQFLAQKVPGYMIPAVFVQLEALPLTPNGKVNRLGLPPATIADLTSEATYVTAHTPLEAQLADIWMRVLNLARVGIRDNFFDLGGNSLLAIQMFAQIEAQLQQRLPLAILFKAPTIAQLAMVVQEQSYAQAWSPLVEIQTGGSKPPLFCMHGGGFNVLIYRNLARHLGPDYPVYGLQAQGLNGDPTQPIPDIRDRLEDLAADYIQEIRRVQPHGPYFLVGLSAGGNIAFEMAQQLQAAGEEIALLGMFDSYGLEGRRLLPPLPRLISSLHYAVRYGIPEFVQKGTAMGLQGTWVRLRTRLHEFRVGSRASASREPELGHSHHASEPRGSGRRRRLQPALEDWMERVSQFILDHSAWSFITPSQQLQGQDDSLSNTLKRLEQAYDRVHTTYVPRPYAGRITVFRAKQFPPGFWVDAQLGWGNLAMHGVDVYQIPGHHTSIMESPLLAQWVQCYLETESAARLVRRSPDAQRQRLPLGR
jgi:amino acid adenylation domain-containing protein